MVRLCSKYIKLSNFYAKPCVNSSIFRSQISFLQNEFFSSISDSKFSTINEEEVLKFSQLSKEWWSPNGPVKLLHSMNPLRVLYMRRQYLEHKPNVNFKLNKNFNDFNDVENSKFPFKGLRILDMGCGGGLLSESLVRLGASVVGADASSENIQIAKIHSFKDPRLHSGPGNLEYRCITAEKLLEQEESFDIVCAMEIIEHVNNPIEFLRTCIGLVKPGGGHLFLSTISRTPLSYFLTILLAEKVFKIIPSGTHDFNNYIKPDEIQAIIQEIKTNKDSNNERNNETISKNVSGNFSERWGFVTDIIGIGLNPITGKWFEFYKWIPTRIQLDVNYIITAKRI
ncbi:hypothetical protein Glove_682g12 [Diversispora epigaea]|uniref:Ubiquinone biosynthesis O-methyltransferase, mitochondrial n=1 Tax=Diversispora epigaea TaxID=1348612 RepID=A0A397G2J5_9GLOM|nr:hypothetical protein Glove_682g12 [Diversispora epigaea]